jgi:hypothetical protein
MVCRATNNTFILAQRDVCEPGWRLKNHEIEDNVDLAALQRRQNLVVIRDHHFHCDAGFSPEQFDDRRQ